MAKARIKRTAEQQEMEREKEKIRKALIRKVEKERAGMAQRLRATADILEQGGLVDDTAEGVLCSVAKSLGIDIEVDMEVGKSKEEEDEGKRWVM